MDILNLPDKIRRSSLAVADLVLCIDFIEKSALLETGDGGTVLYRETQDFQSDRQLMVSFIALI